MTEKRIERHSSLIEDDLPGIYTFIARTIPPPPNEFLTQLKKHFGKSPGIPNVEFFSERATRGCKD